MGGREYASIFRGGYGGSNACLHFSLGEGPAIDAVESNRVITVDDFRLSTTRWPAFSQAALNAGIRSALYIPVIAAQPGLVLVVSDTRLSLSRPTAPDWTALQHIRSLAEDLLSEKCGVITAGKLLDHINSTIAEIAMIYQAAGFLASHLTIAPPDALDLLRLQAWADRRPLGELCEEVLTHPSPPH